MAQAEGTLRRCATHAEGDSRTQRLLGEALFAQRAFEEALTCYDLALAAVRPLPFPSLFSGHPEAKRLGRPGMSEIVWLWGAGRSGGGGCCGHQGPVRAVLGGDNHPPTQPTQHRAPLLTCVWCQALGRPADGQYA